MSPTNTGRRAADPQRQASTARDRLLTAGTEIVTEVGLDVGLGRLSFEEAIKRAGVARATAYRCWSSRQAFADAVVMELARGLNLSAPSAGREIAEVFAQTVGDGSVLSTPQGRRDVVVDFVRMTARIDFDHSVHSPSWRLYTALSAACASLPGPEPRTAVIEAIQRSDRERTDLRARLMAQLTAVAGYRLRPPLSGPAGFEQLSRAAGATFTGCFVRAQYDPQVTEETMRLRAFGMSGARMWSPHTLASTGVILSHIEPDPGVTWDEDRIADLMLTDFAELL